MKVNRPALYFLAIIMIIASVYAWLETKNYEPKEKNFSVPLESVTQKEVSNAPEIKAERKIPNIVAGRKGLIEKAKKFYQTMPENKDEMPLGNKSKPKSVSTDENIKLPSVNVVFSNDLYACAQSECPKADAVVSANGFNIFKGEAPRSLNSKSKALVTYDKGINQYGIWERRVIIETTSPVDLREKLASMKFESIEHPQDKLFIAEYVGNLSDLDGTLSELKNIANVSTVRLEITYSRNRTN